MNNEWATPQDLYDALDEDFHFKVDAACTAQNAKAPLILTDALKADWSVGGGNVWLNPPYSKGLIGPFMRKAYEEHKKGMSVVCPNRSYHQLLHRRQEVLEAGFNPNTHHKCTDCKEFKPFKSFSKNKTRASGFNNLCRSCDSIRSKERYSRRVETFAL